MSTPASPLSILASTNNYIELGLVVAGVAVPVIKGIVSEIKSLGSSGGSVTYQVVVSADEASLGQTVTMSLADLAAINAELERLKAPTLEVPLPPAPAS